MKKLFALLLAGVMLLGMTGCRSSAPTAQNETEGTLGNAIAPEGITPTETTPTTSVSMPPEGTLTTPDGKAALHTGGYSWSYTTEQGITEATIADQSARPVPASSLKPVAISSQHAQEAGYSVTLHWDSAPSSIAYTCWPDTVWEDANVPAEEVVSSEAASFFAKPGAYIYEIVATWDSSATGHSGTVTYYTYIVAGDEFAPSATAGSQADSTSEKSAPATMHLRQSSYTFAGEKALALVNILRGLDYRRELVCRCLPEFTVDSELGTGYGLHLNEGYARCEKGQAKLTEEQIKQISAILEWAEATYEQYTVAQ